MARFRGWLDKLLTTPVNGLENYREAFTRLEGDPDAIKVFVEVDGD